MYVRYVKSAIHFGKIGQRKNHSSDKKLQLSYASTIYVADIYIYVLVSTPTLRPLDLHIFTSEIQIARPSYCRS